ncbi:MAG: LacI family transcriptional regulator [Acidimicrobiia bacterium]|nr:LacI family transcriptional regulator [Acidimicrobiia bacterium]
MRDVANAAGVSLKTVSRVVNNEASVTAGLEQRVRSAIRALGYQPDDRARYLRRAATGSRSLGFVQTDVANPFFAAMFRGLEDVVRAEGFLVFAGSSDADPDREEELVRAFIARRVDGLVIASARSDLSFLAAEVEHGTPLVFVDLEPAIDLGDVVRTDHYGGAAMATRHLLEHGHRRIAFLGDSPMFFSARERRRAFVDVMAEAGCPTPWLLTDLTTPEESEAAAHELLNRADRPTALFTAQNFVTIGAVKAMHGLGVQHEIALVGFDDVDIAELVEPKLTVVPQDPGALGRLAGERLFARLASTGRPFERTVLESKLIPRGSGEIRPS